MRNKLNELEFTVKLQLYDNSLEMSSDYQDLKIRCGWMNLHDLAAELLFGETLSCKVLKHKTF